VHMCDKRDRGKRRAEESIRENEGKKTLSVRKNKEIFYEFLMGGYS